MPKTKFIQIAVAYEPQDKCMAIHALDQAGRVWLYNWDQDQWGVLPDKRAAGN